MITAFLVQVLVASQHQIVFWRENALWTCDLKGAQVNKIVGGVEFDRPLVAAPDRKTLLFWDHDEGHWDLIAYDLANGKRRNLTPQIMGGCRSAAYSDDGKWIAFMSDEPGGLFVMKADGSEQRFLAESTQRDSTPAWSPDGRTVAFEVEVNGVRHMKTVPRVGGPVKQLGPGKMPFWVAGPRLGFLRDGAPIWSDGKPARLSSAPSDLASLSPNRQFLALGGSGWGRVSRLAGPALASLRATPEVFSWSPDSSLLGVRAGSRVRLVTVPGGKVTSLEVPGLFFAIVRR